MGSEGDEGDAGVSEERKCERCGRVLVRRRSEHRKSFSARKFCSHVCFNSSVTGDEIRPCEQCGEMFNPRKRLGIAQADSRFCSVGCSRASRRKTFEVVGVELSAVEIARMTGEREATIRGRAREGRNLLSGKMPGDTKQDHGDGSGLEITGDCTMLTEPRCSSSDIHDFDSPNLPAGSRACYGCGAIWIGHDQVPSTGAKANHG